MSLAATEVLIPRPDAESKSAPDFDAELVEKLVANKNFWEDLEEIFSKDLTDEVRDALDNASLTYEELLELRKQRLDELLEEPGEAIVAYMLHARSETYTHRIASTEDGGSTTERFGTRNRLAQRLDDIFEIRGHAHGSAEFLYSSFNPNYVFPRVYTIQVQDNGASHVFVEEFDFDDEGRSVRTVKEVGGDERKKLVRHMFESSLEAAAAINSRSAQESDEADRDAMRRLEALNKSRDPYLYHVLPKHER